VAPMQSTLDAGEYMQGELFSEHYIEDRLRDSEQFIDMREKADEAFRIIRHVYEQKKEVFDSIGELSLRDEFIKPVLAALEHVTDVEVTYVSHKGTGDIPDIVLFNTEAEKREAQKQKTVDSDAYFNLSIGLMETKRWGIDLDKGRTETPSLQIKNYLRMTTVKWGILTNGKKWRLYCKDSSFTSNIFLEFDLQWLLEHDKMEAFHLFYAFFSHDAFARVDGQPFLDKVYEQNVRFAQEVEDGGAFGDVDGVVQREDGDVRPDFRGVGHARDGAEDDRRRRYPAVGEEVVFCDREATEPQRLRRPGLGDRLLVDVSPVPIR